MLPQVEIKLPKDLGERTWGMELLVVQTKDYIGKVMYMHAGHAGGLQYHERKDECSYLVSGTAWVYTDTGDGKLSRFLLNKGAAVYIPPGAVHKVEAITDCVFVEWSNPVFDDRVRVEARYGREDTEGLPTTR